MTVQEETAEVSPAYRIDADALGAWLAERGLLAEMGPLAIRQFTSGQSNPTYFVEGAGRRFVVRKKPPGPLLPSAHQVEREYRVLGALAATDVPVPRVFALCEDEGVIGQTFYVMDYVDGRVLHVPSLPGFDAAERRAIYDAATDVLARLHRVDVAAIGLADYGRADGFLARQVARWSKQYEASKTEPIPAMDALGAWLGEHLPPDDDVTLVHGDYRIENMIFAPHEPRVLAVLDWELSTLGNPLLDLAYTTVMHYFPAAMVHGGVALTDTPGVPSVAEIAERYARETGRDTVPDLRFYTALAFFRMASILQGIRKRVEQGNASGAGAAARGALAPHAARIGLQIATAP